jgi:hypothetical protein
VFPGAQRQRHERDEISRIGALARGDHGETRRLSQAAEHGWSGTRDRVAAAVPAWRDQCQTSTGTGPGNRRAELDGFQVRQATAGQAGQDRRDESEQARDRGLRAAQQAGES